MKTRLDDGRLVKLIHFPFEGRFVLILRQLQHELPNVEVLCEHDDGKLERVPIFRIKLGMSELSALNGLAMP